MLNLQKFESIDFNNFVFLEQKQFEVDGFQYKYMNYHNIPYPPFLISSRIDNLRDNFIPKPNDIFVVTFPKCGTAWTQQIVSLLLNKGEFHKVSSNEWLELAVSSELTDTNQLNDYNGPKRRVFKSHAPTQVFPSKDFAPQSKIIVVMRNPKDCVVSLYHHSKRSNLFGFEGEFKHMLELFMKGQVESGDWFNFYKGWWEKAQINKNILFITYEQLYFKNLETIEKIAQFLNIETNPELIEKVSKQSNFDLIKTKYQEKEDGFTYRQGHFRKGQVGDWKNYFTVASNKVFNALIERKMDGAPNDLMNLIVEDEKDLI